MSLNKNKQDCKNNQNIFKVKKMLEVIKKLKKKKF